MTARENSRLWPGDMECRLNGQRFVNIWHVMDPKIIFANNQQRILLCAKIQTYAIFNKIGRSLCRVQKKSPKVWAPNESWYAHLKWSIIYVGCCAQLSISHFISCLTKTWFRHSKVENALCVGQKWKTSSVEFLDVERSTCASNIGSFQQSMRWSGPWHSSFNLKAMQPWTW
jgi:hypothetical protein